MTNKLNLILDFNNFAMRSLFTCQFMEPDVKVVNFEKQAECDILVRKIVYDMCKVVRLFKPCRVIISCDSKNPWRGKIFDEIEGETYKGTREKDEKKNWANIYGALDDVKDILKQSGFIVNSIDNTEADDITTMWKEYLFDKNEDIVMVSSDMDWVQLVGMNQKKNVCVCFNPIANNKGKRRLFIDENISNWLKEPDAVDIFFNSYNYTKKTLNNIVELDSKIEITTVDPNMVLLEKIMAGDVSDNIPAFWSYYKNGRKQNVTKLKASHVFEALNIHNVNDLVKANDEMLLQDVLEKEMKHEIDIDFKKRIERQRTLVELNSSMFPKEIVAKFMGIVQESLDSFDVNTNNIKMEDVLMNTKYLQKKNEHGKLNSIFDDINSLSRYSSNSKSLFE